MTVSTLIFASAACSGTQWSPGDSAVAEQRTTVENPGSQENDAEVDGAVARAGDIEAHAGNGAVARAGDVVASTRDAVASGEGGAERDNGGKNRPRKVTLKVAGDPGTTFSGVCTAGKREDTIEGRVPKRYAYESGGGKLECEIRNENGGALEVVVTGEGVHSVQRSHAQGSTIRFAISGGGVSSSTSSVSINQTVESSNRTFSNDSP